MFGALSNMLYTKTRTRSLTKEEKISSDALLYGELKTIKRLITEIYPTGIISIVSDTFSFWDIMSELTVALKDAIMNRKPDKLGLAKVVFRPDSGDPVKIICGDETSTDERVRKGAVEVLWDIFGGTITEAGYKLLDPHVGLIYGDSITMERCQAILEGLAKKGFASGNIVFGIGSYTYQYCTRDSLGFAMKATYGEVNGLGYDIYKNPKTDSGKKSARGLLKVVKDEKGIYKLIQNVGFDELEDSCLIPVFQDGKLLVEHTLAEIRKNLFDSP